VSDDEDGVYDTSANQPTTESSGPDGRGVGSASEAGANKRDPLSSSPSMGGTIAGRTINTGASGDVTNPGGSTHDRDAPATAAETPENKTGGPDTGGKGATGQSGADASSAQDTNARPSDSDVGSNASQ
jgi:hypothetical protein